MYRVVQGMESNGSECSRRSWKLLVQRSVAANGGVSELVQAVSSIIRYASEHGSSSLTPSPVGESLSVLPRLTFTRSTSAVKAGEAISGSEIDISFHHGDDESTAYILDI